MESRGRRARLVAGNNDYFRRFLDMLSRGYRRVAMPRLPPYRPRGNTFTDINFA